MTQPLDPQILDQLTRIKMPRGYQTARELDVLEVSVLSHTYEVPRYSTQCLVLGSGAAGLRAAVELDRRGQQVLVATAGVGMGTSACSGSDKQTLHTASSHKQGDNFEQLAEDLALGGCMDKDVAYVEAVGSLATVNTLQYLGLPLPQDKFGAVLRYQTDHDEYGRATSCGPRTSRLMVKVLLEELIQRQIPVLNRAHGVKILRDENGVTGLVVVTNDPSHNPFGLAFFDCQQLVLATGGPGELFRDSVYPGKCFGSLGLALEAGIRLSNLTEHQFGIGTNRSQFPWNLSGTYMQAMPYVFSTDEDGREFNFLADYYRTTAEIADNTFLKGYQWPFHAERALNFGSSLLDIAVLVEMKKGRKIWLDFQRNPLPGADKQQFDLRNLSQTTQSYLRNNQAELSLPIERLQQMNPLAIELYRQNGTDLTQSPLPFTMNHQHMNGGLDVDIWGQTNVPGCYAIGELASTHGVTRPGGAALNAGQVFGLRAAEHIAQQNRLYPKRKEPQGNAQQNLVYESLTDLFSQLHHGLESNKVPLEQVKSCIQHTMSDCLGAICNPDEVEQAEGILVDLIQSQKSQGIKLDSPGKSAEWFAWQQQILAALAVVDATQFYLQQHGGSRGARLVVNKLAQQITEAESEEKTASALENTPDTVLGPLQEFSLVPENKALRNEKIITWYQDDSLHCATRAIKPAAQTDTIYFEKNWPDFLTGQVFNER